MLLCSKTIILELFKPFIILDFILGKPDLKDSFFVFNPAEFLKSEKFLKRRLSIIQK